MPDDWPRGHPQRKDYPLGGVPVEYKGATVAPPIGGGPTTDDHHRSSPGRARDEATSAAVRATGTTSPSPARSGSSSTWVRSTRRPTACCA